MSSRYSTAPRAALALARERPILPSSRFTGVDAGLSSAKACIGRRDPGQCCCCPRLIQRSDCLRPSKNCACSRPSNRVPNHCGCSCCNRCCDSQCYSLGDKEAESRSFRNGLLVALAGAIPAFILDEREDEEELEELEDDLREILKELIEDQISKQEFTVSIRSTNEAGGLSSPIILDIVNSTLYTTVTGSAFGKTLTFTRDQPYFPLTSDGSVRAYLDDAESLFEPLGNSRLGLKFERTEITVKLPTLEEATVLGAKSIYTSVHGTDGLVDNLPSLSTTTFNFVLNGQAGNVETRSVTPGAVRWAAGSWNRQTQLPEVGISDANSQLLAANIWWTGVTPIVMTMGNVAQDGSGVQNDTQTNPFGTIDSWNVQSVTNFSDMFTTTSFFVNPTIYTRNLFSGVGQGNTINRWDVSNATLSLSMFRSNTLFRGNITGWNVGNVSDFSQMFESASQFAADISLWDVGKPFSADRIGPRFQSMFAGTTSLTADIQAAICTEWTKNTQQYSRPFNTQDTGLTTCVP